MDSEYVPKNDVHVFQEIKCNVFIMNIYNSNQCIKTELYLIYFSTVQNTLTHNELTIN